MLKHNVCFLLIVVFIGCSTNDKRVVKGSAGQAAEDIHAIYARAEGYFNEQDYEQAVYWWKKAAEQGHAQAQNNLGGCYAQGLGVAQDYTQAVYWYTRAAELRGLELLKIWGYE
jgi:TPR repeat protein